MNEEASKLSNTFSTRLLAATRHGAYVTKDKAALAGLSDAKLSAAAQAAASRKVEGYALALQNTTQQPDLVSLTDRATRQAIFEIRGIAPRKAMPPTHAIPSRDWRSSAPAAHNCLVTPATPPGSSKTRWPRRLKPR